MASIQNSCGSIWEIFAPIDKRQSQTCCRSVGCTSTMQISRSRCSPRLRSGVSRSHWSRMNTSSCSRNQSLRWSEFCDTVHCSAGSSYQKLGTPSQLKSRLITPGTGVKTLVIVVHLIPIRGSCIVTWAGNGCIYGKMLLGRRGCFGPEGQRVFDWNGAKLNFVW